MEHVVRVFDRSAAPESWPFRDIRREWLVTNGLGGYASGTLDGLFSRRYHGLLVAALRTGRMMTLNGLSERIRLPNRTVWYLGAEEISGVEIGKILPATQFRLEQGLPVWRWRSALFCLTGRIQSMCSTSCWKAMIRSASAFVRPSTFARMTLLPTRRFFRTTECCSMIAATR
jgi:hypothetical protein